MNYLAHLFLAGKNDGMILGALLEDYTKGGIENEENRVLPEEVKDGLRLHRFIDTFTDSDSSLSIVKQLYYPEFGKYASVIIDVIFDHFLHKNWDIFAIESFETFKNRVYLSLSTQYQDLQPLPLKKLVKSMIEYDWLKTYIHLWGVERALISLNKRVEQVDLSKGLAVMEANYNLIDELFLDFFFRLQKACNENFDLGGKYV